VACVLLVGPLIPDPRRQSVEPDRCHFPPKAGTYLAACVFYAVLSGRSPDGFPSGRKITPPG